MLTRICWIKFHKHFKNYQIFILFVLKKIIYFLYLYINFKMVSYRIPKFLNFSIRYKKYWCSLIQVQFQWFNQLARRELEFKFFQIFFKILKKYFFTNSIWILLLILFLWHRRRKRVIKSNFILTFFFNFFQYLFFLVNKILLATKVAV